MRIGVLELPQDPHPREVSGQDFNKVSEIGMIPDRLMVGRMALTHEMNVRIVLGELGFFGV